MFGCQSRPKREEVCLERRCIAPIIRLVAARATGRMIPYLDLTLDQFFERLCNLPFLIALSARSQRAGFPYCFYPDLD
jgi:hypothetical protein